MVTNLKKPFNSMRKKYIPNITVQYSMWTFNDNLHRSTGRLEISCGNYCVAEPELVRAGILSVAGNRARAGIL